MTKINNDLYEHEAHSWWQEGSSLSQLKMLNPGRFRYLDKVMAQRGIDYAECRVLDIGCGGGFICETFAKRKAVVSGVDPSPGTIAEASRHAKQMGYDIHYHEGSGEKLPFADNSFDVVSCCDVLEHVEDLESVLRETSRVLKPGGIYFYDTINRSFLSWLFMIKVLQDWPLTRRVPRNTHVWKMFIKPEALHALMSKVGLNFQDETGLGLELDWKGIPAALEKSLASKRISKVFEPVKIGATASKQVLYMGWAINEK